MGLSERFAVRVLDIVVRLGLCLAPIYAPCPVQIGAAQLAVLAAISSASSRSSGNFRSFLSAATGYGTVGVKDEGIEIDSFPSAINVFDRLYLQHKIHELYQTGFPENSRVTL